MRGRHPGELAVDLGTSRTLLVARAKNLNRPEVVANQATAVALKRGVSGTELVAIGDQARQMLGRTPPDTTVVQPVRNGAIADFGACELFLGQLFSASRMRRPRVLVCIPAELTEVERRAVQECARAAGAKEVALVPTLMAAAAGTGLPIDQPVGSMVVEIGGGRTQVAVCSLGGLVVRRSSEVAGEAMDTAIVAWLRRHHNLLVGPATAEAIKLEVGCAIPERARRMRVRGRDMATGGPKELDVTSKDIATALQEPLKAIIQVVLDALAATPPELSADIMDRGILISGGAGALRGLTHALAQATGLPVLLTETPDECVARGAALLLSDRDAFDRVAL